MMSLQDDAEDYVDIMDDEEAASQSRDQTYDTSSYYYQEDATNQESTLGMDLHLSGDEGQLEVIYLNIGMLRIYELDLVYTVALLCSCLYH